MKKHLHKIAWVEPGSIEEELGLEPGDAIEEINGNEIEDIFDYQYYVEDEYLDVLILTKDGEECVLEIEKDEDEDLGITFESSLMDEYHSCCNSDKLFSHRASHGKRGNLGCFMCLQFVRAFFKHALE